MLNFRFAMSSRSQVGGQIGSGLSLYGNVGLDYRLAKWFKLQFGVNFDTEHQAGGIIGAGLTW